MSPLHLQGLLGHKTMEMTRRYTLFPLKAAPALQKTQDAGDHSDRAEHKDHPFQEIGSLRHHIKAYDQAGHHQDSVSEHASEIIYRGHHPPSQTLSSILSAY
jgi:hypothetical protein